MPTSSSPSRLSHAPASVPELVDLVRAAVEEPTAIYPVGGGTSLPELGSGASAGWSIELGALNQIIDYPAADMTITVQAGIRMDELHAVLRQQNQQLPLDVPEPKQATLGGVIATNFNGPRRYGYGTARDYVIGIRAVDGHANEFAGGGRVVKNVAGYDFCKLLTGSHGTLGIITEVTLKLKPIAARRAALLLAPDSYQQLQEILAQLVQTAAQPVAVEWLHGPHWETIAGERGWPAKREAGWLALLLEGIEDDVHWSARQLQDELAGLGARAVQQLDPDDATRLLDDLTEFPAALGEVVFKATTSPSCLVELVREMAADEPSCSFQAHAGDGVTRIALPEIPASGIGGLVMSRWQPLVMRHGGNLVAIKHPAHPEFTSRLRWGRPGFPAELMRRVKQQFDPKGVLNPGAFLV
jgi:glycolate oxidase FAD binding subunit